MRHTIMVVFLIGALCGARAALGDQFQEITPVATTTTPQWQEVPNTPSPIIGRSKRSPRVSFDQRHRPRSSASGFRKLSRQVTDFVRGGPLSFIWPTIGRDITDTYGSYRSAWRKHAGLDIDGQAGDPIYAVADGRVIVARTQGGYGRLIVIDHGNGFHTKYAHAQTILVQAGETVTQKQQIATIGNSGHTIGRDGTHLHFEIWQGRHPLNPRQYLPRIGG